MNESVYKIDVS